MKLGLVFSGQGSQYKGMGIDLLTLDQHIYQQHVSNILGYDILKILKSENDELNQTLFTQPAILFHSILGYHLFKKLDVMPDGVLGFSLGEYSALYASGIFTFEDIFDIIKKRAFLMEEASLKYEGKMAAVLNADMDILKAAIHQAKVKGIIDIANYNSKTQQVISGEKIAVDEAISILKDKGVRRVIELSVSGGFHTALMSEAGEKLYQYIKDFKINPPLIPIYLNSTSYPLIFENLFLEMKNQIQSSVYFEQSILHMVDDGFTHFIEIGPGKVLSGLIKKINPDLEVINLENYNDLILVEGWLYEHGFKK